VPKVKGRKGKVSVHAPKAESGIGVTAPLNLNLGTRKLGEHNRTQVVRVPGHMGTARN